MTKAKSRQKAKAAPKPAAAKKRVRFFVELSEAREVFLVGDFNQWDPAAHPMKNLGNGQWEKTVTLRPGNYEYKLVVDGDWRLDNGNESTCENCFGTQNNLICVSIE
jgi:1,4-alpha-glucan branching enzyme